MEIIGSVITKVKMAFNYNWNISQWGIKRYSKNHLDVDERLIVLKEICQFVKEDMINTDIVKKCFLIQVCYLSALTKTHWWRFTEKACYQKTESGSISVGENPTTFLRSIPAILRFQILVFTVG